MTRHVLHDCDEEDCFVCRGGLGSCIVCGGAEASLLAECPGYLLTLEAQDAIANGKISSVSELRPEHRSAS